LVHHLARSTDGFVVAPDFTPAVASRSLAQSRSLLAPRTCT
jgi:hypothetical protein